MVLGTEEITAGIRGKTLCWNDHWPVRVLITETDGREWCLPCHRNQPLRDHTGLTLDGKLGSTDSIGHGGHQHQGGAVPWRQYGATRDRSDGRPGRNPEGVLTGGGPAGCGGFRTTGGGARKPDRRGELPPRSLCCLPDGYRVWDGRGGKWPVKTSGCVVVGFGDEAQRYV